MSNPYEKYYLQQAGSGLPAFHGIRFQHATGWFSNLFSRFGIPLLKYLGNEAASTGHKILGDVMEGENISKAAKKRLITAGKRVAGEALDKTKAVIQSGGGKRRKTNKRVCRPRTKRKKKVSKKKKKKLKRKKSSVLRNSRRRKGLSKADLFGY